MVCPSKMRSVEEGRGRHSVFFDNAVNGDQSIGVNSVGSDINTVRKELAEHAIDVTAIYSIRAWRPALDVLFDYAIIFISGLFAFQGGVLVCLIALCVVGNRQRALGNLLHEAGHKNLFRNGRVNDWFAAVLLAPPLTSDLSLYRGMHARHHALLGQQGKDPDLIAPTADAKGSWWPVYRRQFASAQVWFGSIFGHLGNRDLGWRQLAWIGIWWIALFIVIVVTKGISFASFFVALWFAAKATTFHAITTFREMCDHFALQPGGIYSFTRDTVTGRHWRALIHPHNNGYHLSHHLMPSVPYYRLPEAQKLLSRLPSYARNAIVCESYFTGSSAVIRQRSHAVEAN